MLGTASTVTRQPAVTVNLSTIHHENVMEFYSLFLNVCLCDGERRRKEGHSSNNFELDESTFD